MSVSNKRKIVRNKVLVTGASGLLGVAAIEKFLSAGWEVVGVSRRKPELPSGRDVDFLSVDLRDEERARAAFEPLTDITHVAYTALHEKPELVAGWSGFPGGPSCVGEAADADLVADVMVWAARSPQAAKEAFNITKGDVFEWRNVWPAVAETLGVETGPDTPMSVAAYLDENANVWNKIVARYDLRSQNMRELVGQGDQHADFAFAYGAPEGPRAFVSTVKLRQAGFTKTIDTEVSFRNALQSLIDHKLLPPAAK